MSEASATNGTAGLDVARREGALGSAQVIRSPEQVALDLPLAGPVSRVLAFSVDYGLILILEILIFTGLLFLALSMADIEQLERVTSWLEETQSELEQGQVSMGGWIMLMLAVWVVLDFLLQTGYFIVCELLMQGRSPGKAAIGLRVVRDGGLPVTLRESALRNLLRVVDMLPTQYLIGLISMVVSKEVRRLGDFAAGTLVVREERSAPARPIEIDAAPRPGAPAFRFERDQIAAVGPVELRLVRQTLRRLDQLPAWKRREVLERTCHAIRARIGWEDVLEPDHQRDFLLALLRDAEGR